jgi:hypothetical protein
VESRSASAGASSGKKKVSAIELLTGPSCRIRVLVEFDSDGDRGGRSMAESMRIIPFSTSQKRRLAELIRGRGGLPRGKASRCTQWLVREVRWQAARYAELLAWNPTLAELVHTGKLPIADAVILFRLQMDLYDDEGIVESVVDQWYRDSQAPLKYFGSDARPIEYPPSVHEEVQRIIGKLNSHRTSQL